METRFIGIDYDQGTGDSYRGINVSSLANSKKTATNGRSTTRAGTSS